MPKSHKKKTRRGGGLWDDLTNKASSLTSGMSTSSWNPFAKKTSTTTSSTSSSVPAASSTSSSVPAASYTESSSTTSTSPTMQTMGGKRRRIKRGGSYTANMSQTNLAATALPVSGIQTVKAQTWVGGKTKKRRRRHKHNKSCKHRK